jgi:membrane-bound lytic murein transglycosylase D
LAYAFGVDPETFRRANRLWRLQQLPPGVRLRLSLPDDSPFRLSGLREARDSATTPVRPRAASKRPPASSRVARPRSSNRAHRVRARETLGAIARRYQTSTQRLMEANGLQSSRIEAGAVLRIPES